MAKVKFDGVIEAVHYNPEGNVEWVRAYLRRGPTFSDHILLDRQTLVEQIKAGKKFFAGKRIPLKASTFEISAPVRVIQKNSHDLLVAGDEEPQKDHLKNVPIL
jgi:hypothetical protein